MQGDFATGRTNAVTLLHPGGPDGFAIGVAKPLEVWPILLPLTRPG